MRLLLVRGRTAWLRLLLSHGLAALCSFSRQQEIIGGGVRSAALTSPGFIHDICSSVYPLAVVSPVFAGMPLAAHGLEWIDPPLALAHPFDDGTAAVLERSITATAQLWETMARRTSASSGRW